MLTKQTFCWNCWRDWQDDFLSLAPWEQAEILDNNPYINPNHFEQGRCPFCGKRYEAWFGWDDDVADMDGAYS